MANPNATLALLDEMTREAGAVDADLGQRMNTIIAGPELVDYFAAHRVAVPADMAFATDGLRHSFKTTDGMESNYLAHADRIIIGANADHVGGHCFRLNGKNAATLAAPPPKPAPSTSSPPARRSNGTEAERQPAEPRPELRRVVVMPTDGAPAVDEHLITDEANAKRAADRFAHQLVFSANGWAAFKDKRWHVDDDSALGVFSGLGQVIMQEAASIAQAAAAEGNPRQRKQLTETAAALAKHSQQSENIAKIRAAMELARPKLKRPVSAFDRDPFLLNCTNGTVDLRTGRLLEHDREHYLTKLAGCDYDPEARCDLWQRFLEQVFPDDEETIAFMGRLVGYLLTGSVREAVLPIFHGTGANGKTTLLRAIARIMGEYARPAPAGFFEFRRDSKEDQHAAILFGLRLVVGHETERGAGLRESFVKLVTGDDLLSARRLYQEPFDFAPTHKLILATNHRPRVAGTDEGIWRRVLLVPFNARFSAEAGNIDPLMREKLEAEAEGILAWAVRGCLEWQREGLNPPSDVKAATAQYRRDEDTVAQFVDECCALDPRSEAPSGEVYRRYCGWADASGLRHMSQKGLVEQLKTNGIKAQKGAGGRRMLTNIKLLGENSGA